MYTSDPSVKESRIRLSGEIVSENDTMAQRLISLDPMSLEVLFGDEKKEYKIEIMNNSDQKLKATLVSANSEYMDVDVPRKDIKPGKSRKIKVKFNKTRDDAPGGFQKSFTIELSDSLKTRYTIPVTYLKEKATPRVAGHARSKPGATAINPTGLKTKTGNDIEMIEVGTNKKK